MIRKQTDEPEQKAAKAAKQDRGEWLFRPSHQVELINVTFTDPEPETFPRAGLSDPPEVFAEYQAASLLHIAWEEKRFRKANVPAIVQKRQGLDHTLFLDLSRIDESRSVHEGGWVTEELVNTSVFTSLANLSQAGKLACKDACEKIAAANAENSEVERMVAAVRAACEE